MKFKVYFNTHKHADWSDTPRPASAVIEADTGDEAREILRDQEKRGTRWIGSVHHAESIEEAVAV